MDKAKALEVLRKAVKIDVDKKVLLEELVIPMIEQLASDSENKVDDKLVEFLKPLLEKLV